MAASCFPCLSARKKEVPPPATANNPHSSSVFGAAARIFSFKELAAATRNFSDDCRIIGREPNLYKGYLKSVNQVVAIKLRHGADLPDASGDQGYRRFLAHVLTMSSLRHPNLVNLIGFCDDGDHRILVHEYMPLGSLEDHLHDPSRSKAPLDWNTRMNIAAGVARGLEYLHDKSVMYRCVTSWDILLGDGYTPKLSQLGLAELDRRAARAEKGWCVEIPSTYDGTIAPETLRTGRFFPQTSVYGFGVVLLEMITGRRPADHVQEEDVVKDPHFATPAHRPLLKDRTRFRRMADPTLKGRYPPLDLQKALKVASARIHEKAEMRAPIGIVVAALSRLVYDVIVE